MNYAISPSFGVYPDFMIISDEGRELATRKIVRKIQVYAPIYSKTGSIDGSLKNIIEDCLFKNSKDSYFLQLADFVAYFCMLWLTKDKWDKKVEKHINLEELEKMFEILSPILNKKCSKDSKMSKIGLNLA